MGTAIKKVFASFDDDTKRMYELREHLIKRLLETEDVFINGADEKGSAPHIVSASVKNVRAEVLLHALEDKGVYISSGSACASNRPSVSKTLKSIGVADEYLDSTIRFSMSVMTTKEEIDYAADCFADIVSNLRKYVRR